MTRRNNKRRQDSKGKLIIAKARRRPQLPNRPNKSAQIYNKGLTTLRQLNQRIQSNSASSPEPNKYVTVVDNGAQQTLIGNEHWRIEKKYNICITACGAVGPRSVEELRIVDASSTLLSNDGSALAVLFANQGISCESSEQTLIAEDQLEHNGVEVHSRAKPFGGRQCIVARHPGTKKAFKIDLGWDGSTKFIRTRYPTQKEKDTLPHIHLTASTPYNPADPNVGTTVRRMITHRNRAFNWSKPEGAKYKWTPRLLTEWRARFSYTSSERVKRTFAATTQLYQTVPQENESIPKNYFLERFSALGAPYRGIRRNDETFSVDIVPERVANGKLKHLLVFSGLTSKFSAIYDLLFTKCADASHTALAQFIRDHGIPGELITDGDKAENFSKKWIKLCTKHQIRQTCSEAYKQNQNYVERFVQEAKQAVTRIRQATGQDDNAHIFDMWSHISDVDNHMSRKSLKWRTPLEVFTGETPDLSIFRFKWFDPVFYREWTAESGSIKLLPGRFLGISWNVGDSLCMKVLVSKGRKRNVVLSRGVVLPRDPNSSVPPNLTSYPNDNMFPELEQETKRPAPDQGAVIDFQVGKRTRVAVESGDSEPEPASDAGTIPITVPPVVVNTEPESDAPVDHYDPNDPTWEDVSEDDLAEGVEGKDDDDSVQEETEDAKWSSLHSE